MKALATAANGAITYPADGCVVYLNDGGALYKFDAGIVYTRQEIHMNMCETVTNFTLSMRVDRFKLPLLGDNGVGWNVAVPLVARA